MKAKKIIALAMSAAMAVGTVSLFAACGDDEEKGGDSTLIWYAVGCDTKGTLGTDMTGGWDPLNVREEAKFTQSTTNPNEYTLSLDIYAGNVGSGYSFKFLYKTSEDEVLTADEAWPRQIGIKNVEGCEGDGETAVVKMDGVTYFTTGGGADANNMALTKGNDGTYKFTLTMQDGNDTNPSIKFEKTAAIKVSHEMYVYGDINNFGFGNGETLFPMAEKIDGENTTWTAQLVITSENLKRNAAGEVVETGAQYAAVHLYNLIDKKTYHIADSTDYPEIEISKEDIAVPSLYSEDSKFNLFPEGRYMLTYDQKTNAITVSNATHEMYFRGTDGTNEYWGTTITADDAKYKLTESTDKAVWYGVVTVPAGETHQVKLFNSLTKEWYGPADNWQLTEGTYFFKFEIDGNKYSYEKMEYYVVGTFLDGAEKVDHKIQEGVTPKFAATETANVLSATVVITDVSASYDWIVNPNWGGGEGTVFSLKAVATSTLCEGIKTDGTLNGIMNWAVAPGANNYIKETGTYTVTYNIVTKEISITKN